MNKIAVCALLRNKQNDKLYLGVSRKNSTTRFGLPGGKVEYGESLEQACARELFEEAGLTQKSMKKVFESVDEEGWHCTTFLVEDWAGDIKAEKGLIAGWMFKEALFKGPFGKYIEELIAVVGEKNHGM